MREDMAKVLIERPRYGHSFPSAKTKLRIKQYDAEREYDDLPTRVSATKLKHPFGRKSFTDLLGPLMRYLRSNVGRPWNKVYSEMVEHLDLRKTTGRHVFEHAERMVTLNCYVGADGKVYEHSTWNPHEPVTGLYVHPKTKLLCWKDWKSKPQETKTSVLTRLTDNWYRLKIAGTWFVVQFAGEGQPSIWSAIARWAPIETATHQYFKQGTRVWEYQAKRQLSSKELKAAKLQNDTPQN